MAIFRIADLTPASSVDGSELLEIEQGGVSLSLTATELAALSPSGTVTTSGSPVANQVAIFTGATAIEGTIGVTVDADSNVYARNFSASYSTVPTAAGTTVLTLASSHQQRFTGSTTQICQLPVVSTLSYGFSFLILNESSGTVTVQSSGGNTVVALTANTSAELICVETSGTDETSWSAVANVGLALTTGKLSQFAATTSAELLGVISDETGTGSLVFATAPTLSNPLITASTGPSPSISTFWRGDGTWATLTGGGDALVANPLSQFAATTSLQLKGVLSDETGSGALVFATSPTLVTPVLGTPTSGTLTSCTGLPVSTGVSGLGTGIATALGNSVNTAGGVTITDGTCTLTNKTMSMDTNTVQIYSASYAANHTLTSTECYGGVIYVTAAATMTLPPVQIGMSVTVITIGAVAVSVDPNAAEVLRLDGTALTGGHKASNLSATGDIITLTFYAASTWYAASNAWSDGG